MENQLSIYSPPHSKRAAYLTLILLLIGLPILIIGINRSLLLRPRASSSSVDFVFNPTSKSLNLGQTFDVKVSLETTMNPLPRYAATNFTLQFDPKLLQVVEVRRVDAQVPKFASIEVISAANLTNRTGELPLLALETKTPASGAAVVVGQITFKTIAKGNTKISFKAVGPPLEQPVIVSSSTESAKLAITTPLPSLQVTIVESGPTTPTSPSPTRLPPTITSTPTNPVVPTATLSPTQTPTPSPPPSTPTSTPLPPTITPTPLIDETYCHQFTAQTCPAPCMVTSSCPTCRDTTCHAVDHRIPTPTPTPIPIPTNTPMPTVTPRI